MPPENDPQPTDDPKPAEPPPGDPKPAPSDDDKPPKHVPVGELVAERNKRQAAEAKVAEYERSKMTDTQRLEAERDEHKTAAETATARLLRLEVAVEKGLTASQAKRLTGTTRDELEADADELLELFSGAPKAPAPPGKPRENLRGGGEPGQEPEETDPAKLAAAVPRR